MTSLYDEPLPEIFITPAGEKLWTVSWHRLKSSTRRSETCEIREAVHIETAYCYVWKRLGDGYVIHDSRMYDALEDALAVYSQIHYSQRTPAQVREELKSFAATDRNLS